MDEIWIWMQVKGCVYVCVCVWGGGSCSNKSSDHKSCRFTKVGKKQQMSWYLRIAHFANAHRLFITSTGWLYIHHPFHIQNITLQPVWWRLILHASCIIGGGVCKKSSIKDNLFRCQGQVELDKQLKFSICGYGAQTNKCSSFISMLYGSFWCKYRERMDNNKAVSHVSPNYSGAVREMSIILGCIDKISATRAQLLSV